MATGTILVVDDDPAVVIALQKTLESEGYTVLTAADGLQALRTANRTPPDLVLLDLKMPGMSGVGFLKEIAGPDGKPRFPVIVLTAHANMKAFFETVDVAGFLLKPCRHDDLVSAVERAMPARRPQPRSAPPAARGKRKVLLVEDDEPVRHHLVGAFEEAGYGVETCDNPSEAVGKAILSRPDVVVIKEVLPEMNGHAVATVIRGIPRTQSLPVILYDDSGYAKSLSESALARSGIHVLIASNNSSDLVHAVHRALET